MERFALPIQVGQASPLGPEPRVGSDWEGRTDEWIAEVVTRHNDSAHGKSKGRPLLPDFQDWSFPTDGICDAILTTARGRTEEEIRCVLRAFLFENVRFLPDDRILDRAFEEGDEFLNGLPEYKRRLFHQINRRVFPQPGVRWVIDLLPYSPQAAIEAIRAYLIAYEPTLPDGRAHGLWDAIALIRARWMASNVSDRDALFQLSPRELERMVAALYRSLGYGVQLTPASKDGGRDVIITRNNPGNYDLALVECKAYVKSVGVRIARELLGVVSDEKVNRGVIVTTGFFTQGAKDLAGRNPRLELVDGDSLALLFCQKFGTHWPEKREHLMREFPE
jgi:restriction system protein